MCYIFLLNLMKSFLQNHVEKDDIPAQKLGLFFQI